MSDDDYPAELMELAVDAVQQAVERVRENGHTPTFVIADTPAGRDSVSFDIAESYRAALNQAREYVEAHADALRTALAGEGSVRIRLRTCEAILVEARGCEEKYSVLLTQRYRHANRFRPFRTIGAIGLRLGDPITCEPLWGSPRKISG